MRPARSRTLRGLEIAGRLIAKGAASSLTVASPQASRARMARRVGSGRGPKTLARGWGGGRRGGRGGGGGGGGCGGGPRAGGGARGGGGAGGGGGGRKSGARGGGGWGF